MKQLVQDMQSGTVRILDVPAPIMRDGGVLVRNGYSVISAGTERTKVQFARKSLLGKARERPDQVRKVIEVAMREGVASTLQKVRARLSGLSPMGYSCSGIVEAVGAGVTSLEVGQRVACAGAGYANHGERVWVPENLVVPVPEMVSLEHAAFATLGAIALHGVRQAEVNLGECVVVVGLGILGQLTVQILQAAGVRVIGVDVDPRRVAASRAQGGHAYLRGEDIRLQVAQHTGGLGADAVVITAASSSEDPIRLAGDVARDRGRVVVVGAVPIHVPRSPYFEKELQVRLSRSYGPGRYDTEYEEKGHDYPVGYVRWTERRNLAEFLRLIETGAVKMDALITHRFAFEEATRAYELLSSPDIGNALGVVLAYPASSKPEPQRTTFGSTPRTWKARSGRVGVGVIGAGNFATATLIPQLQRLDVELLGVVSATGTTSRSVAEKFGFRYASSDVDELLNDPAIHAVVIATRHNEHARLAARALRAGKVVFVEKPLALDQESLDDVLSAAAAQDARLMVGFNRRFAPATRLLMEGLATTAGARVVHVRANAGAIPPDAWLHDPAVGGGRLIGEGCHFVDLALYLAGSPLVDVSARAFGSGAHQARFRDNLQITLRCADGSLASVLYTSVGNLRTGKERIEVFAGGCTGTIDDFRRAEFVGTRTTKWKGAQDKGHREELRRFVQWVREGGPAPISLAELEATSRATLDAAALIAGPGNSVSR